MGEGGGISALQNSPTTGAVVINTWLIITLAIGSRQSTRRALNTNPGIKGAFSKREKLADGNHRII